MTREEKRQSLYLDVQELEKIAVKYDVIFASSSARLLDMTEEEKENAEVKYVVAIIPKERYPSGKVDPHTGHSIALGMVKFEDTDVEKIRDRINYMKNLFSNE